MRRGRKSKQAILELQKRLADMQLRIQQNHRILSTPLIIPEVPPVITTSVDPVLAPAVPVVSGPAAGISHSVLVPEPLAPRVHPPLKNCTLTIEGASSLPVHQHGRSVGGHHATVRSINTAFTSHRQVIHVIDSHMSCVTYSGFTTTDHSTTAPRTQVCFITLSSETFHHACYESKFFRLIWETAWILTLLLSSIHCSSA